MLTAADQTIQVGNLASICMVANGDLGDGAVCNVDNGYQISVAYVQYMMQKREKNRA